MYNISVQFASILFATSLFAAVRFNSAEAVQSGVVQLEPVFSGLTAPVYVTHARDGSNRLFVVEQAGRIRVYPPNATASTVFLDITAKVLSGGERGLLGLAFHPQ